MKTQTLRWTDGKWDESPDILSAAQLGLVFGSGEILSRPEVLAALRENLSDTEIVGCSTAGEILGGSVSDDGLVVLLVEFESTTVRTVHRQVTTAAASRTVGQEMGAELNAPGLRHVVVLSNGLQVNGTELVAGLRSALPAGISATGGLAGDGSRFEDTVVVHNERIESDGVIAIGFFGDQLEVRWGTAGGWEAFGPRRKVTRAEANVLYELDGRPALDLYKTYLGDRAVGLPATGLLFPLELLPAIDGDPSLVRTILAVDEATQSLTFAGDVPAGRSVRLMKSTIDRLIWGAETAGGMAGTDATPASLALLVSCVGRRLVLGQRVEEEIEAVLDQLGQPVGVIGFYSYGEIGPGGVTHGCELHNQTMTLTTFAERPR